MNVSGAEAVVAAASPWIGQGESACLVKPYVDLMTPSEIHLTMTSGLFLCVTLRHCQLILCYRFLYYFWFRISGIYQSGCSTPEPRYLLSHEYSSIHCH